MLETLESPIHSAEKKLVLKAISESAGKITVADIASKTALPVLRAGSLLNQIAYETGGHLLVGTAGNVVYQFDPNFQNSYLTQGSRDFFRKAGRVAYNAAAYALRLFSLVMFFILRVSFGIMLILSVVIVVVLVVAVVVALLAKMMGNDDDSGGFEFPDIMGGLGGIFRYWAFDWLWDWWYWGDYIRGDRYTNYGGYGYDRQIPQGRPDDAAAKPKDKERFLDKCFSFLFGDGDPNQGLEERYWQTLARVLKANNGVVVAEQLAPYAKSEGKNEDWVLPVLVRFNGNCDVSENGNIIYSFPSFRQKVLDDKTEHSKAVNMGNADPKPDELHSLFRKHIESQKIAQQRSEAQAHLETYLREHLWELTHVTGGARTAIICFAVFIMLGSLWLIAMAAAVPLVHIFIPLLLAMSAYGAMFLIIPGIRSLFIKKWNSEIEARNSVRFTAANKLQNRDHDPALAQKLSEADHARHEAVLEASQEELAYNSDKDLLEQEFENPNLDGFIADKSDGARKNQAKAIEKKPESDNDGSEKISLKDKKKENS